MLALAALLSASAVLPPPVDHVEYEVSYASREPGRLFVSIAVPGRRPPQVLVVPRAVPMGYGEQPYDRFVSDVAATDAQGRSLPVERADGPRWRIGRAGEAREAGEIRRVRYTVDLARMEAETLASSDASKARPRYVGLLGYSVLAFLEGMEGSACRLTVRAPEGWPVFSTLAPVSPPGIGVTRAEAPGYYELADSQVAMGPDLRVVRVGSPTPLFVALYAEAEADPAVVAEVGREALDAVIAYFGSAPFPHYTVHMELLKPVSASHVYGFSMEHLQSGTFFLGTDRILRRESAPADRDRHLYNLAHHIAHSWIPKRCYGEGYFPFTWEVAPVIDTIWLSEGFAQYVAIAALAEGRPDTAAFRERLLETRFRKTLAGAPDFIRRMSAVELSRIASTRYGSDFRTGAGSFARGGLMAAEMDDLIRARTQGRKGLRDALRHLVGWSQASKRPFTLEELPRLLQAGAGVDVGGVLARWLAPNPPGAPGRPPG